MADLKELPDAYLVTGELTLVAARQCSTAAQTARDVGQVTGDVLALHVTAHAPLVDELRAGRTALVAVARVTRCNTPHQSFHHLIQFGT